MYISCETKYSIFLQLCWLIVISPSKLSLAFSAVFNIIYDVLRYMVCSLGHFDFTNCLDPYRPIIHPPELCFINMYLS